MAFDYDETNPLGSTYIADYPANEVAHRTNVLSSVDTDHYAEAGPSTPAQDGFHRQVSLPPLAVKPSLSVDAGFVYAKDIGGITELFYEDDNGVEIQLTDDGSASPDKVAKAGDTMTGDLILSSADLLMQGTGLIKLLNAIKLQGRDVAAANWRDLIGLDASDILELGDALLAAAARIYVDDVDGLSVYYSGADKIVWNQGHFANPPVATETYVSGDQSFAKGVSGFVAHGLGSLPGLWRAHIRCTSVDCGYAVGDVIPVGGLDVGATPRDLKVYANATNFGWESGNTSIILLDKGGDGSNTPIDYTKWVLVFQAWY